MTATTMQDTSRVGTQPAPRVGRAIRVGPAKTLHGYIINLGQARERWMRIERAFAQTSIGFSRVNAVSGSDLAFPRDDYAERQYRLRHGKRTNPAEVGCYLSHLEAMRQFLDSGHTFALIAEDDLELCDDLQAVIEAALDHGHLWDILRLTAKHHGWPLPVGSLGPAHRLCIALARRTGGGAYIVTRHAARVLVDRLRPMRLPFDHALDREWRFGLSTLCIDPPPVRQNVAELGTQINATADYRLPRWKRHLTVAPYRCANEVARFTTRLAMYVRLRLETSKSPSRASERSSGSVVTEARRGVIAMVESPGASRH